MVFGGISSVGKRPNTHSIVSCIHMMYFTEGFIPPLISIDRSIGGGADASFYNADASFYSTIPSTMIAS